MILLKHLHKFLSRFLGFIAVYRGSSWSILEYREFRAQWFNIQKFEKKCLEHLHNCKRI